MDTERSPGPVSSAVPREASVRRLLELEDAGQLRAEHVELVAEGQSVSARTIRRWLTAARAAGTPAPAGGRRDRFVVTAQLRARLAFWRGNVAAVHRELLDAQAAGGSRAPSLPTLHRAIQRDVLPNDRAGLRLGEPSGHEHDVVVEPAARQRNEVSEDPGVPTSMSATSKPVRSSPKALSAWMELNDRQQGTLQVIYELDQWTQASRRKAAASGQYDNRPATIWRALDFAHEPSLRKVFGWTEMQQRLERVGWDNQGNGSTVAALATRELITRGHRPTSAGHMLTITLTNAGRAAARAGLTTMPAMTAKPALSRRSWEVLALLWAAGRRGQPLKWTYSKTIELSLIERHVPPLAERAPGGYAITDRGRDFYREHYASQVGAYPDVQALHPDGPAAEPWPAKADEILTQHRQFCDALRTAWKDAHDAQQSAETQAGTSPPVPSAVLPAAVAEQQASRHQLWCDTARQRADLAAEHAQDLHTRAEHAARAYATTAMAAFRAATLQTDPLQGLQPPTSTSDFDDWDEQPLPPPPETGIHAIDAEATKRHAAAMGAPQPPRGPAPKRRSRYAIKAAAARAAEPPLPGSTLVHLAGYLHGHVADGALTRRLHPAPLQVTSDSPQ